MLEDLKESEWESKKTEVCKGGEGQHKRMEASIIDSHLLLREVHGAGIRTRIYSF